MKFYLKLERYNRSRAYCSYERDVTFAKINHAIDELKKKEHAHSLVFQDDETTTRSTLMFFEGTHGNRVFSAKKLSTLVQVGAKMYVPKSLIRKTTRKRKRRCKKSKSSETTAVFVKSTELDSNSRL